MRKHRSARERERLFRLRKRTCYLCGLIIQNGEAWDIEHLIPFVLTRDDSDDNIRLAHAKCHKVKSADDIRGIRKADRQRQKHEGTYPKPIRKLQGRGFQRTRVSP